MFGWDIWRVQFSQHVLTGKKIKHIYTLFYKVGCNPPYPFPPLPSEQSLLCLPETKLNDISQAAQAHYLWVRASEVIWSEYTRIISVLSDAK